MIGSNFKIKEDPKENVRAEIAKKTNRDTLSFVGSQADLVGLLTAIQFVDTFALKNSDSFDDFKKNKMDILQSLSPDTDLVEIATTNLDKIKGGEAILTASVKGVENVVAEALGDSTIVAKILASAATNSQPINSEQESLL